MRASINEIIAKHTGQKLGKITRDTERDFFMSAEESKGYGIVDSVLATDASAKLQTEKKDEKANAEVKDEKNEKKDKDEA